MKAAPSKAASAALPCKQGLWLLQGGVQERCQAPRRWHPPRCQADGAAPSPPPGLSQEGCGRGGRQAGGCEPPGRRVLLPAGQRCPPGGGTSPARCREGVTEGLGLSKRGRGGLLNRGVHEGVCPKKRGSSIARGHGGWGLGLAGGWVRGTSSAGCVKRLGMTESREGLRICVAI